MIAGMVALEAANVFRRSGAIAADVRLSRIAKPRPVAETLCKILDKHLAHAFGEPTGNHVDRKERGAVRLRLLGREKQLHTTEHHTLPVRFPVRFVQELLETRAQERGICVREIIAPKCSLCSHCLTSRSKTGRGFCPAAVRRRGAPHGARAAARFRSCTNKTAPLRKSGTSRGRDSQENHSRAFPTNSCGVARAVSNGVTPGPERRSLRRRQVSGRDRSGFAARGKQT